MFCTLYLCVFFFVAFYLQIINSKKREIFLFLINYVTSTAKKKEKKKPYGRLNIFCSINKQTKRKVEKQTNNNRRRRKKHTHTYTQY
jgi:hypothetical protein